MPDSALSALSLLIILAMTWLRTRLHYPHAPGTTLRLTRPGVRYFAVLLVLMAGGWFAAPALAHALRGVPVTTALARAFWFLGVYALFVGLHRVLKRRGAEVFTSADPKGGQRG